MTYLFSAILLYASLALAKNIHSTETPLTTDTDFNNNIIEFDSEYKTDKKYGMVPWYDEYDKESNRYTIVNKYGDKINTSEDDRRKNKQMTTEANVDATPSELDVIPLELISTTNNYLDSIVESTTEPDLTVIPLSTTQKVTPIVEINQPVTLPSTHSPESTTDYFTTEIPEEVSKENKTRGSVNETLKITEVLKTLKPIQVNTTVEEVLKTNTSKQIHIVNRSDETTESDEDDEAEVPEDYYDSKDVIPTKAPNTDVVSVIFGLAGSVVESVAEKVVPKGIYDLFKRMQKQNEALEAERLRSREENGGLGQFGRGILKSISSGLSRPLSQLMAGARDIGSLDNDRGFVGSLASGVSNVANVATSVVDAFKVQVQAIYPGTLWCGDGHSATARSSDLGLFLFTDTCCREHDACKIYIRAGDTKYGLTNTGLFTRFVEYEEMHKSTHHCTQCNEIRSHCSCDAKFRECLKRTSSLVSGQIGLTYFNVLGPQCFRRTHPIVRCIRRTRITGQKCEEYELDYTKPKMWQWFDNETF